MEVLFGFLDARQNFDVEVLDVGFEELTGCGIVGFWLFKLLDVGEYAFHFFEYLAEQVFRTVVPSPAK